MLSIVNGIAIANDTTTPISAEHEAAVREILRQVPLIDGHNDAPWAIRSRVENQLAAFDFEDTTELEKPMHTDLMRLRQGGVGGQFWSVWVPPSLEGAEAVVAVLEQIDVVHRLVERYPDDLEIALTADDVLRIHAEGRIASLIGMEGGHSIDASLAVLRQLYAVGARYMTLTHWSNNRWADSATDSPKLGGLSNFGRAVVREMNRLGMLVDLSHVSTKVMHEVLDISRAPIVFSHSCAFAINPHPRNVPDDVLERLPENGGVVMLNFGTFFLDSAVTARNADRKAQKARLETLFPGDPNAVEERMNGWYEEHPVPAVPLAVAADHLDHFVEVAGIDHVGLGSDFDGISSLPVGLEDVSGYPPLLAELLTRGWSREDVAKVAGLNVLRAMRKAEKASSELQRNEKPVEVLFEKMDSSNSID